MDREHVKGAAEKVRPWAIKRCRRRVRSTKLKARRTTSPVMSRKQCNAANNKKTEVRKLAARWNSRRPFLLQGALTLHRFHF